MENARAQTSRLLDLLRREQGAMADFLVTLAAFHRERLWVGMGHSNLFHYLRRELKLSSGSAFLRKTAAEIAPREAIPQRVLVTTLAPRALPSRAAANAAAAPASALSLELGGPILPDGRRQAAPDAAPTLGLGAVLPDEGRHVLPATAPTLDFGRVILPDETAAPGDASPGRSSASLSAAPAPAASMVASAPARGAARRRTGPPPSRPAAPA